MMGVISINGQPLLEYRSSVILLLVSELAFKVSTAQSGLLF